MNIFGLITQKTNSTVQIAKAQFQKQASIAKTVEANSKSIYQKSTEMRAPEDKYDSSTRVMNYEDFYELMTSDKSSTEKHAALVEKYGNVLSFCAFEKDMESIKNGRFNFDEMYKRLEIRAEGLKTSMNDFIAAFEAADPNRAEVERSKELGAKATAIQSKMLAGKSITGEEKSFLKEHFPELYAKAMQIEQEVAQLKARLKAAKSKEEAARIYNETKLSLMSGGKNDRGMLLMMPAIDEAYRNLK